MITLFKIKHLALFLLLFCLQNIIFAQIPVGYYNDAEGKSGAELKTTLFQIVKNPTVWEGKYFNARSFFNEHDRTPDGLYIWDMYSDIRLPEWIGTGTNALNREHSLPKSWFGVGSGQEDRYSIGCDYHNLYPSNAKANNAKSNYPLGEVNMSVTVTFNNGVSKVGKSRIPINNGQYTGNVFEPADEYKGDFARDYMYMVTCYEDYSQIWTTSYGMTMLQNNTYPTFTPYAIDLLMKWHRQDQVSEKEINRNEAVYDVQGNRNPFVDHPEYAEYIWGGQSPVPDVDAMFSVRYYSQGNRLQVTLANFNGAQYEIYSVSGIKIKENALQDDGIISCSGLPSGMYIISIYSPNPKQNKKYTEKFVVNVIK